MTTAAIVLDRGSLAAWFAIGIIAGRFASWLLAEASYGLLGELFLGSLGALAGGFFFCVFAGNEPVFWGSLVVAFIGAVSVIGIGRTIAASRSA